MLPESFLLVVFSQIVAFNENGRYAIRILKRILHFSDGINHLLNENSARQTCCRQESRILL